MRESLLACSQSATQKPLHDVSEPNNNNHNNHKTTQHNKKSQTKSQKLTVSQSIKISLFEKGETFES
jgi:hypothetical protein